MRILFLLVALFMSSQNFGAQELDTFWSDSYTQKLLRFNNAYTPYARKYFGCPEKAVEAEECKPNLGGRDWKLEEQVIKAAEIWNK